MRHTLYSLAKEQCGKRRSLRSYHANRPLSRAGTVRSVGDIIPPTRRCQGQSSKPFSRSIRLDPFSFSRKAFRSALHRQPPRAGRVLQTPVSRHALDRPPEPGQEQEERSPVQPKSEEQTEASCAVHRRSFGRPQRRPLRKIQTVRAVGTIPSTAWSQHRESARNRLASRLQPSPCRHTRVR